MGRGFSKDCQVTDDSIMTLAVAKAMMETERMITLSADESSDNNEYYSLLRENVG